MSVTRSRTIVAAASALAAVAVAATAIVAPAGAGRPVFNPVCLGTKIEGGTSGTYALPYGDEVGTIDIVVEDLGQGDVVSFTTDDPSHVIGSVSVKGGTSILDWSLVGVATPDGVTTASGLHAQLNPSSGKWYGVSYLCFSSGKVVPDGGGGDL